MYDYDLSYSYDADKPHQAIRIGGYYFAYDENGNVIRESEQPKKLEEEAYEAPECIGDIRFIDRAWGMGDTRDSPDEETGYLRSFSWTEDNRLRAVSTSNKRVSFLYDAGGERTSKIGVNGETLYFNSWFSGTEDGIDYRYLKHIFIGSERLVTRVRQKRNYNWDSEDATTYYYHPDHLGSVSVVSNHQGLPYERVEYLPFGEVWIEETDPQLPATYPSGPQELDEETGLYYYGARYYGPTISRWMSADPAGFVMINPMGSDGKPRARYSVIEATNWYAYVSNNPVKYVDPTGEESADAAYSWLQSFKDAPEIQEPGDDLIETSNAGLRTWVNPETGETTTEIHKGKDLGPTEPGDTKQSIKAAADGEVARTGYEEEGAGNYIVLKHKNGYETKYFHAAEKSKLKSGASVNAGDEIGTIGNTGNSTAVHLHFEIRKDGIALDPDVFLNRARVMHGKE